MFELTNLPINPPTPSQADEAGGIVTFEGRVRNTNEGSAVERLEYEAYEELALHEGNVLLEETRARFGLSWIRAIHRIGLLEVGDIAVWIGCGAAHRREAFAACEYVIDEMKKRLPIWKKEHYRDQASEWVNLQTQTDSEKITRAELFARQLLLPQVGASGQIALDHARVLVVGAGGLGCAVLPYLAASGIGTIGIVEPDVLEISNLHRQILYSYADLGRSKARLAAESVRRVSPFLQIEVFEERVVPESVDRLVSAFDVVVDGTDSLETKFLLNDACQAHGKPLVQASIYQSEGYVQTILPGGPCLRCQWQEAPADGCVGTCAQTGVLGVTPGLFGILQANEVLKLLLGFGEVLSDRQLLIDLATYDFLSIKRTRNSLCLSCHGVSYTPKRLSVEWVVSREEVLAWSGPFVCIDVRESDELPKPLNLGETEWQNIPMSRFDPGSFAYGDLKCLLVCASGARSESLAFALRERGHSNVYSLRDGMESAG